MVCLQWCLWSWIVYDNMPWLYWLLSPLSYESDWEWKGNYMWRPNIFKNDMFKLLEIWLQIPQRVQWHPTKSAFSSGCERNGDNVEEESVSEETGAISDLEISWAKRKGRNKGKIICLKGDKYQYNTKDNKGESFTTRCLKEQ